MATTYTLINSNVLSSSASSVTFSSIPATYTDLVLRWSARQTFAAITNGGGVRFNGLSTTIYSQTEIIGDGSSASTSSGSNNDQIPTSTPGSSATSNTFSNNELYIPNYLVNANKPVSVFMVSENNATTARIVAEAGLFRSTGAINSITINAGFDFVSGSSFYLYGISNA